MQKCPSCPYILHSNIFFKQKSDLVNIQVNISFIRPQVEIEEKKSEII